MTGSREIRIGIGVLVGILTGIFFLIAPAAAETGSSSSFENNRRQLLAQEDTQGGSSLDDFEFLDEDDEAQGNIRTADPLRGWNKAMFVFNDKAYFWVLKPVAQGYSKVVPAPARKGVNNFFFNLLMPIRFVNCVLQGKGKAATGEFGRFMLNSTVGVLGFGNPAAKYPDLNPDAEDLGQTFGRYGIGNGFYIVWPIIGPSTLRDSVGKVGDYFLDPLSYVDSTLTRYSLWAGEKVNSTSLRIGEYEALKDAAIDPYTASRDVYLQYRREKVRK